MRILIFNRQENLRRTMSVNFYNMSVYTKQEEKLKMTFPRMSCRLLFMEIRIWQRDRLLGKQSWGRGQPHAVSALFYHQSDHGNIEFFCSSIPRSGHKHYESKEAIAGVGAAAPDPEIAALMGCFLGWQSQRKLPGYVSTEYKCTDYLSSQ